jgi:hypothetical protein
MKLHRFTGRVWKKHYEAVMYYNLSSGQDIGNESLFKRTRDYFEDPGYG